MTPTPSPSALLPARWMHHGWQVVLAWVLSRSLMGLIYLTPYENDIFRDPLYYWQSLEQLGTAGVAMTMPEYPTPVLWIMDIPRWGGLADSGGYIIGFVAMMLLLDAGFTWLLWRTGGPHRPAGTDFWLLLVLALGPLVLFRFDMLPAVLVGAALILLARWPRTAGALIALGAAVKLWPALLFPALLTGRDRTRGRVTVGFVVVGAGLALASLLTSGWARTTSPLGYQSDRGLQIESILATGLMAARAVDPGTWTVELSRWKAFEIFGPGVPEMIAVSNLATLGGLLVIVGLLVAGFRQPRMDRWRMSLLVLAIVMIMIVTNKTLSPQYLVWLGGPLALMLLWADTSRRRRIARRMALVVLGVAVLTQLVYPVTYPTLFTDDAPGMPIAAMILVVRNLALMSVAVWIVAVAVRELLARDVSPVGTS